MVLLILCLILLTCISPVHPTPYNTRMFSVRACTSAHQSLEPVPLLRLHSNTFQLYVSIHYGVLVVSPSLNGTHRAYLHKMDISKWTPIIVQTHSRGLLIQIRTHQILVLDMDIEKDTLSVDSLNQACVLSQGVPVTAARQLPKLPIWCSSSIERSCALRQSLVGSQSTFFGSDEDREDPQTGRQKCLQNVCWNGGTCLINKELKTFDCACTANYTGVLCESSMETVTCAQINCLNGGTCLPSSIGPPVCLCTNKFEGVTCEKARNQSITISDPCKGMPCSKDTICMSFGTWAQCKPADSVTVCDRSPSPCLNNGTCSVNKSSAMGYRCDCPQGWTGDLCEQDVPECGTEPCLNGGTCVEMAGGFQCVCRPLFTGLYCERAVGGDNSNDQCSPNPCLNGGRCMVIGDSTECRCQDAFIGLNCENYFNPCSPNPCVNGGQCALQLGNNSTGYQCTCLSQYTGINCQDSSANFDPCTTKQCNNGGQCRLVEGSPICTCPEGYAGEFCDQTETENECSQQPCQNGGSCEPMNPVSYRCRCADGFAGRNCTDQQCNMNCLNSGTCQFNENNEAYCECPMGYSGVLCDHQDIDECAVQPCLNQGTCVQRSDQDAYDRGLLNGTFTPSDSSGRVCICPPGTSGDSCELLTDNGNDSLSLSACASLPCANNGLCEEDINDNTFKCLCQNGTTGATCDKDVNECDKGVCSDNAITCINTPGSYVCECELGWQGDSCDTYLPICDMPVTEDSMCENNALTCVPTSAQEYHCRCELGYTGPNCDQPTTASFNGKSLLVYNNLRSGGETFDIQVAFRSTIGDGILATGIDLFNRVIFSLMFVDGVLALESDVSLVTIPIQLVTGNWTSVSASLNNQKELKLAYYSAVTGQVLLESVIVKDQSILPVQSINIGDQFIGCMRDIRINNVTLVPSQLTSTSLNVALDCQRQAQCQSESICGGHGRCVDLWTQSDCECDRPYLKPDCTIKPTEATFGYEQNRSYASVAMTTENQQSVEKETDVSMFIRTTQADGSLFYLGTRFSINTNTFLSAELYNGQLKCNVQLGGAQYSFSGGPHLNDGDVHLVGIKRSGNMIVGSVNATVVFQGSIPQRHSFLIPEILLIGGYPTVEMRRAKRQSSVNDAEVPTQNSFSTPATFKGTIQDVRVNGKLIILIEDGVGPVDSELQVFGKANLRENVLAGTVSDDSCASNPCANQADCSVTFNDFTCSCQFGWRGRLCDLEDLCSTVDRCPQLTTCENTQLGYQCVSPVTFASSSSAKFEFTEDAANNNSDSEDIFHSFELNIRTRSESGLIMYMYHEQSSDYVLLYLHNNTLNLDYRLGASGGMSSSVDIAQPTPINNGQWHHVAISLLTEQPYANVDRREASVLLSGNPSIAVGSLLKSPTTSGIYFGAVPDSIRSLDAVRFAGLTDSFLGCLQEIKLGTTLPKLSFHYDNEPRANHFKMISLQSVTMSCVASPQCTQPDACLNNGICADLWNLRQCACVPGFNGDRCEVNIDDCEVNECTNDSTCVDGIEEYTCDCLNGYDGQFCENDINECQSTPCLHQGTCSDLIGRFECNCTEDYIGATCDVLITVDCQSSPCQNNAACTDKVDPDSKRQFACECPNGYEGILCEEEIDYCESSPCINNATCISLTNSASFECQCAKGYEGSDCSLDIDECTLNVCANGADCVNVQGGFECVCADGWTGDTCMDDVNECLRSPCDNQAICVNTNGSHRCDCMQYYFGASCEVEGSCLSADCSNNSTCTQQSPSTHTCDCLYGYQGARCESITDFCASSPCQNDGVCSQAPNSTDWSCLCANGFDGQLCENNIDDCQSRPCVNGRCIDGVAAFQCDCAKTGFTGHLCAEDMDECSLDTRMRQDNAAEAVLNCVKGVCDNVAGSYKCTCEWPYFGQRCAKVDPCLIDASNASQFAGAQPHQCENGAKCLNAALDDNESVTYDCDCADGFDGVTCAVRQTSRSGIPLTYIVGPLLLIILLICIIACIAFMLVARQKRMSRGTYSPSRQEMTGARVHMAYMMKAPPPEGLI